MFVETSEIVRKANHIYKHCGSRDPYIIVMEYEANVFASQIALDDDEFLEYCEYGYDTQQIACAMHSHINLVALKGNTLISQGYRLRPQEHKNDFLKYNK